MSETTRAALETALQAHIADELEDTGLLVTDYILGAATSSFTNHTENRFEYWFDCRDGQASHSTRGLADLTTEWATGNTLFQEDD